MIDIFKENLTNKIVLEIGTARGGTTRELVKYLSAFENAKLITTDLCDGHFESLKKEFEKYSIFVQFIKTDACNLDGIGENTIDYIICNYTLCAINSNPGCELLALNKFRSVLKENGVLYIEEEFPVTHIENEKQYIWSEKWKILKSCTSLLGEATYNEIDPETLEKVLTILGFKEVSLEQDTCQFIGEDCLDFFKLRLDRYLTEIANENIKNGLIDKTNNLCEKLKETKGMEIPFYRISCKK